MSGFKCPGCGQTHSIFGSNEKIQAMCSKYELELLGEIPLHPSICEDADRGKPTVVAEPEGERAQAFGNIAKTVGRLVGLDA
jgi:ATP-binding protein involved in chromosome partitioning